MNKTPIFITFSSILIYALYKYMTIGIFEVYLPLVVILLISLLCTINPPDYEAEKSANVFWWVGAVSSVCIFGLSIIKDIF